MAHAEHDTHEQHDDHDDDHDDHHGPPPPEEPQSPWWLTLLGAALFLLGGIAFLLMNGTDATEVKPTEEAGKEPATTAAHADTPPPPSRPAITALPALRRVLEQAPKP